MINLRLHPSVRATNSSFIKMFVHLKMKRLQKRSASCRHTSLSRPWSPARVPSSLYPPLPTFKKRVFHTSTSAKMGLPPLFFLPSLFVSFVWFPHCHKRRRKLVALSSLCSVCCLNAIFKRQKRRRYHTPLSCVTSICNRPKIAQSENHQTLNERE